MGEFSKLRSFSCLRRHVEQALQAKVMQCYATEPGFLQLINSSQLLPRHPNIISFWPRSSQGREAAEGLAVGTCWDHMGPFGAVIPWLHATNFPHQLNQIPIGSMYAIYGNIYHQFTPNVSICTIHGSYGIDEMCWQFTKIRGRLMFDSCGWWCFLFDVCFMAEFCHVEQCWRARGWRISWPSMRAWSCPKCWSPWRSPKKLIWTSSWLWCQKWNDDTMRLRLRVPLFRGCVFSVLQNMCV